MPIATTPRGRLFYQTYGNPENAALIFSNSLGTDHTMWRPQIEALQGRFHIIAYDTRGHGASDAPAAAYTLAELGQDVLAVLDAADVGTAHFCGISMGGLTGQWLGIHAPERLGKLIVSNTAAKIGSDAAWHERAELVRREGLAGIAASAASRWFSAEFCQSNPQTVQIFTDHLARENPQGYAACCEALAAADLRADVSTISVPTLVIGGSFDPVTTVEDARGLQMQIADAQMAEVPASHIANIEAEPIFTKTIAAFLTSCCGCDAGRLPE